MSQVHGVRVDAADRTSQWQKCWQCWQWWMLALAVAVAPVAGGGDACGAVNSGASDSGAGLDSGTDTAGLGVSNAIPVERESPPESPLTGPGLAIVTTEAILAASVEMVKFVCHKASRGYRVHVFTEHMWLAGQEADTVGNDPADQLRLFLAEAASQHTLTHLLLIGDPRQAHGPLPMKVGSNPLSPLPV